MNKKSTLLLISILLCMQYLKAQGPISSANTWDNQIFLGNKVAGGADKWRYSGEIQSRFKENAQAMDRWYVEGVATYMPNSKWEIVPDLRVSVLPTEMEFRPGIGILRKHLIGTKEAPSQQLVQQLKYQIDIRPSRVSHGLRYILFYNKMLNEHFITSVLGGVFYSWKPNYNGFEYVRAGVGVSYIFDKLHTINFTYIVGGADTGDNIAYSGVAVVQLIINIRKDYKYVPAKYINF